MQTLTNLNTIEEIDVLGHLLAQIADLQKQVDVIKDAIKDEANLSGQKVFAGALFKATYSETNRSVVDWKAISKALDIPAELIAQYTKTTPIFSVRVTSK
jgi:hypothetical protein